MNRFTDDDYQEWLKKKKEPRSDATILFELAKASRMTGDELTAFIEMRSQLKLTVPEYLAWLWKNRKRRILVE